MKENKTITMALVIKKIVDYYFYLNDEISGELNVFIIMLITFAFILSGITTVLCTVIIAIIFLDIGEREREI